MCGDDIVKIAGQTWTLLEFDPGRWRNKKEAYCLYPAVEETDVDDDVGIDYSYVVYLVNV